MDVLCAAYGYYIFYAVFPKIIQGKIHSLLHRTVFITLPSQSRLFWQPAVRTSF